MKLSAALLVVASMASASAKTLTGKAAAKVLRAARRVEEAEEEAEEDEYAYLTKYSLKMISCTAGQAVQNPEDGEYEYGAVLVRLCPVENGCDNDSTVGCKEGYGDFIVGLNTFVDAYFEDQRDNMQWDDMFQVDRYAECAEYEPEAAEDDANADQWENYQFFIGPTCSDEGDDIKLGFFSEETCQTPSSVDFETVSNGWTLPFSSGGVVSTYCMDCLEYNDDGEYELRDMCMNTYMAAGSKCEANMEYYSYYGQNTQGCEQIEEMLPKSASGNAGKVFGWIVFVLLIGGMAAYIVWWRKKKSDIVAQS